MSKSTKHNTNTEIKIERSSDQNMQPNKSDCKLTLAKTDGRTLSLKKKVRSLKLVNCDIDEKHNFKPVSEMRYIHMLDKPSVYCNTMGPAKRGDISEGFNIEKIKNSTPEMNDMQKCAVDSADFFIDGQNLFHSVKNLYEYKHLNVDIIELCKAIANKAGRKLGKIRFYTGISSPNYSPHWHEYWTNRINSLRKDGVECFSTDLRYIDGRGTEKGIDVMIALDIFERSMSGPGMIVIMSQDNDLAVAAGRAIEKARELKYDIEVASAFPVLNLESRRGITGTTEIRIDRLFYDKYLEKEDSRCQHMRDSHKSLSLGSNQYFNRIYNSSTLH